LVIQKRLHPRLYRRVNSRFTLVNRLLAVSQIPVVSDRSEPVIRSGSLRNYCLGKAKTVEFFIRPAYSARALGISSVTPGPIVELNEIRLI
jgi:hypothetical protein